VKQFLSFGISSKYNIDITRVPQAFSKNSLPASFFKKGFIESEATFGFEDLIPKPYRRDHNPFEKRLDRKCCNEKLTPNDGVINRRNGCGSTVAAQCFSSIGIILKCIIDCP